MYIQGSQIVAMCCRIVYKIPRISNLLLRGSRALKFENSEIFVISIDTPDHYIISKRNHSMPKATPKTLDLKEFRKCCFEIEAVKILDTIIGIKKRLQFQN